MEESHYFLKRLRLENYMDEDALPKVDLDNFRLGSKIKAEEHPESGGGGGIEDGVRDKKNLVGDEVAQIAGGVQADDFFSSLELQSSSKTSSNVISLSFSNRVAGGIVTRSRSFSSALHEASKTRGKIVTRPDLKELAKKGAKKKLNEILCPNPKAKAKGRPVKRQDNKQPSRSGRSKIPTPADPKRPSSNKCAENILEKSLGVEKAKDDDDWILFSGLGCKKEADESKPVLSSDLQNPVRRCTPELFSMNSILMGDGLSEEKDEVDNLLEGEDYGDSFLEDIDGFNYAPPRSHTGGKWKPGSPTVGTSPELWQNQNWDSYLDERHQDDERRSRAETPTDYPSDPPSKFSAASTGAKPAFPAPPSSFTGGKWKPSDLAHRPKKFDRDSLLPVDGDGNWKFEGDGAPEPPPTHTGGKWKPTSIHAADLWKAGTSPHLRLEEPSGHATGNWVPESAKRTVDRSTFDVLAKCQSASGKCLKTSGGTIQYYCSPCNRRLSSKKMYKKHIQSELHFKRVLQENELEFDSRSLKLFRGLLTQAGRRERGLGKRPIKKPETFKECDKKIPTNVKTKGKRSARRETTRCEACRVKVPSHLFGKHLVSYCHSRRIELSDPEQQKLILDNIHAIVKQAPYQCGMCKFYCNTHTSFKKHWSLPVHKEKERAENRRFWCALCSFECESSRSMELHLDSNSHREVILAVNNSIPIVIRHKVVFSCGVCFKEFRFNREYVRHNKIFHKIAAADKGDKSACPVCQCNCKSIKSLQRHILNSHKSVAKVPYFCSACGEYFDTAAEAKIHRNGQSHKCKKNASQGANPKPGTSRPCTYCGETLGDVRRLKSHLVERHSGLLPKCSKCGTTFALSQEVSRHVRNNECDFRPTETRGPSSGAFACESCPFVANVKSELLLHLALHQKNSDEKKISCPLCGSFFTQTSLGVHLRTHLRERTYQCSTCSKAFVRKDRYVKHLRLRHGSKENFQPVSSAAKEEGPEAKEGNGDADGRGSEESCDNATADPAPEKIDKSVEKRRTCGDAKCKYVAKDLNDLESHRVFHVGPKIYQCPECPYSAKTNTVIKRHYMIHVDERSFPCHLCSFKARLKSHLKRHMRLHTGAKPYKCPHCSYTCNILENLRKHVLHTKIHPGKKLYECKLCIFSTNVSKEFKTHLLKCHKDECGGSESNELAGIYSREEDFAKSTCSVSVKPRTPAVQRSKKMYPAALKKKVSLLTQKFSPIAPKPQCTSTEAVSPILSIKNNRNSVEDKRKILKMELEKLKNQIKPPGKKLRRSCPLPFPAARGLKPTGLSVADEAPDHEKGELDGGPFLTDLTPAAVAVTEEPLSKVSLLSTDSSSACVLYENVLPSEEMELYLLKDYQV